MSPSIGDLVQVEIEPGCWLSSERALFLEQERTLVVADIHWGYAHSHRLAGNLLPMWGNEEIAQRLRLLLERYRPARLIWLGDSLHTPAAAEFAEAFLQEIASLEVVVIAGNHDRRWPRADRIEFRLGSWLFHHGDKPREPEAGVTEVMGHIHPVITWSDGAGLRLKLPVLVHRPGRLILPCFSDWSAGADWHQQWAEDEKLWCISRRKILPMNRR
jgi:DNA ligase-associated metallophosphoesterase